MPTRHPTSAGAKNPFEYGRELAASELCDRAAELAKLERVAANRGKLFLIGPRRYGKTSLLHAAERQLRAAVQQHRHLSYVFAGSATRVLADMVTKRGRAFYRLGEPLCLSTLPREEFRSWVGERFEHAGFAVTDDSGVVTSTWELSELRRGQMDSTLFAVPADYRVTDTREPPPAADPAMLAAAMRDALRRNFCDPAVKRP